MNTHPRPNPPGWPGVLHAARTLLSQCEDFVRCLPEEAYARPSGFLAGGTIGKHLRHLVDHFEAITCVCDPAISHPCIDYDHRDRDVPMEVSRDAALARLSKVRASLHVLPDAVRPVRIRVMTSGQGDEAELESTIGRELAFATHHGVHHQAMMKAIASEFGTQAPSDFGKAPSTINYEAGHASESRHPART